MNPIFFQIFHHFKLKLRTVPTPLLTDMPLICTHTLPMAVERDANCALWCLFLCPRGTPISQWSDQPHKAPTFPCPEVQKPTRKHPSEAPKQPSVMTFPKFPREMKDRMHLVSPQVFTQKTLKKTPPPTKFLRKTINWLNEEGLRNILTLNLRK